MRVSVISVYVFTNTLNHSTHNLLHLRSSGRPSYASDSSPAQRLWWRGWRKRRDGQRPHGLALWVWVWVFRSGAHTRTKDDVTTYDVEGIHII